MALIQIPGDELERLSQLLSKVHDTVGNLGDLDSILDGRPSDALGDGKLIRAVDRFHGHWDDGHYQLRKETQTLSTSASDVTKAFKDTDTELGKSLSDAKNNAASGQYQ